MPHLAPRFTRPALYAVLLATVIALPAGAQKKAAGPSFAALDAYVANNMKQFHVPGVAIAIVKNDSIVYAKGYGTRTLGQNQPVDDNTIFAIGSSSKAFTTALIAMAVDEGKMKWNEKVAAYLPSFQLYDSYASRDLTIRDIVSHRSGLARGDLSWYLSGFSRDEILRRVRYLEPSWGFRSTFGYQNLMFLAAGQSVAAAEGRSWDDLVKSKIFAPLGMNSSSTSISALEGKPNVATPHAEWSDTVHTIPYKNIDNIGPAGSINSNVRDMAQWVRMQLGHGKYGTQQILSTGNHDEMWLPNIHIRLEGPTAMFLAPGANLAAYGMGWFLQDFNGHLAVHHGGNIDGMSAMVAMLPDEKLGVVVLTNLDGTPSPESIFPYIFDMYTRDTPRDWTAEYKKMLDPLMKAGKEAQVAAEKSRVQGTKPTLDLAKYAGTYSDSMYGDVKVAESNGTLRMQWAAFGATLEHWNYDTFRAVMDSPRMGKPMLTFVLDTKGAPSEVKLEMAPEAKFRFTPPPADTKPAVALSREQLQGLVGHYKPDQLPLDVDVQLVGETLKLSVPGQPTYTLVPVTSTRFRMTGPTGMPDGFFVDFDVTGGKATAATLVQPPPQASLKMKRQ
ncbi:MAG: serine hydrolase [Gemmatimonadaceae bacterium]